MSEARVTHSCILGNEPVPPAGLVLHETEAYYTGSISNTSPVPIAVIMTVNNQPMRIALSRYASLTVRNIHMNRLAVTPVGIGAQVTVNLIGFAKPMGEPVVEYSVLPEPEYSPTTLHFIGSLRLARHPEPGWRRHLLVRAYYIDPLVDGRKDVTIYPRRGIIRGKGRLRSFFGHITASGEPGENWDGRIWIRVNVDGNYPCVFDRVPPAAGILPSIGGYSLRMLHGAVEPIWGLYDIGFMLGIYGHIYVYSDRPEADVVLAGISFNRSLNVELLNFNTDRTVDINYFYFIECDNPVPVYNPDNVALSEIPEEAVSPF